MKNLVEQLRKEKGLNQEEFGKAIRVSRQTVSAIENGRYNPSLDLAFTIANFFGLQIEEIFFREERKKMKKNNLYVGIGYLLAGIMFLLLGIFTDNKLTSMFFGFAGAGIAGGVMLIYKYLYWTKPENVEEYKKRREEEALHLHDERKERLRDRAGRFTHIFTLGILSISIIIFSILGQLEIIEGTIFVIYLGLLTVGIYFLGVFIYRYLSKRY